jgi:hypothetical protein
MTHINLPADYDEYRTSSAKLQAEKFFNLRLPANVAIFSCCPFHMGRQLGSKHFCEFHFRESFPFPERLFFSSNPGLLRALAGQAHSV